MRDLPFTLLPDFVSGAVVVSLPVGIVGVLVGVEIFSRIRGVKFTHFADCAVGTFTGVGINNGGAVSVKNALALNRNIFRHAERDREALGGSDHGEGDAGITAGGVQ